MNGSKGKSRRIQNIVLGAILILLFIAVCRLFVPFFTVLLWSILLYIILKPLHQRYAVSFDRTTIKGKVLSSVLALVFSFSTVILLLVLLFFVGFQLFRQAIEIINQARDFLASRVFSDSSLLEDISRIIRELSSDLIVISADEIRSHIMGYLSSGLQNLIRFSGHLVRDLGIFYLNCIFMVFILFFFFVDGDYLSRLALRVIPIRKEYIKVVAAKFKEITRKLVLGYIIVALAEAAAAFIIFSIFDVSGSLVFSVLVFFSAFIPMVGPSIIWLPLGLLRIFSGNMWAGILLMVVSGSCISSIETFLRPIILRDQIHLHPLIIFFAILGGITVFGFNGIILGPMVMIIFFTVFDLFLTENKLEQD